MATHTAPDGTALETRGTVAEPGTYATEVWMRLGEPFTITRLDDLNGVWALVHGDGTRVGLYATKVQAEEAALAKATQEWLA
jgi:hypothetical protein